MIPSSCPSEALEFFQHHPSSQRRTPSPLLVEALSTSPPPQEAPSISGPTAVHPLPQPRTLPQPAVGQSVGIFGEPSTSQPPARYRERRMQPELSVTSASRFSMRSQAIFTNPQDVNRDQKVVQYPHKRKMVTEDDLVSEELNKKCRITVSPGEIRLEHDWEQCVELIDSGLVNFIRNTRNPLNFQFFFPDLRKSGLLLPTAFSIQIPRFYPHQPPIIFCESRFSQQCSFVDNDGRINDPFFKEEWTSISTLKDVVISIRRILCDSYHQMEGASYFNTDITSGSATMPSENDMDIGMR